MKTEWLFAWYNLIFIVPFVVALLYVGIYAVTGLTFGEADVHADADVDVDADAHIEMDGHVEAPAHVESEAHFDADADVDADAHVETEAHIEGDGHEGAVAPGSVLAGFLSLLGVGKVPLSLILMVLLLTWGMIGLMANMVLWEKYENETLVAAISIPLAFLGSLICSRLLSAAMVRWFPTHESYIQRRHELLGSVGEVILPVDANFGMAAVRDDYHDLFHVACRVNANQQGLEKGTKVRLIAYNGKQKVFYVAQYDPAVPNRTA
jgi:membrane protein implicated in regulation of membrane protease activity